MSKKNIHNIDCDALKVGASSKIREKYELLELSQRSGKVLLQKQCSLYG